MVLGLLVFQAAWIALTARYPLAFDENYHFGLIQLHAHQFLPFFTHQPPDSAAYGAISRDPSYLYHYLFSFPYRLLAHLTDSLATQVIVLRFINICIFAAGLYVYRKLLHIELGVSQALSNTVLLFFVLLPVVPQLAGQINYDNMMFYLTGLIFVYTVRFVRLIELTNQDKSSLRIPIVLVLQILAVGFVGSIVKFAFGPIFLAIIIVLTFMYWRGRRASNSKPTFVRATDVSGRYKLIALSVLTVIALLLCVERYGANIVQYHSPVPKCHKVLSMDDCQAYSPWARDYLFATTYPPPTLKGIIVYPAVWVHRTVYESMFSITSYIYQPWGTVTYVPYPPLTISNYTAWAVICIGSIVFIWYWRRIWLNRALSALLFVTGFYVFVLFVQNYAMYFHTGEAVAIHGRYLVPVYPVLMLAMVIPISAFLENRKYRDFSGLIACLTLLLFLQGGGITGWILNSDTSWHWQQSLPAARANWLAKDVLHRTVYH